MRSYDAATAAYLAAGGGIVSRQLVWAEVRDTSTGAPVSIGFWTGADDIELDVDGQTRTYHGAGAVLQPEPLTARPGLQVREYQVQLAAVAPEVEDFVKGYDTRFAPVEVHRVFFDPDTRALVAPPHRIFRGVINAIEFPTAAPGGTASCVVACVSETRILTRTLGARKSDEAQSRRGGDRFRRYGDISGNVPVYWGEERAGVRAPYTQIRRPNKDFN